MKRVSITIRQRKVNNGRVSLYLDIYDGGKRQTESLGLFLLPDSDKQAKYHNRATLEAAEIMRVQRLAEVREKGISSPSSSISLLDYLERIRKEEGNSWTLSKLKVWKSMLKHLAVHYKGRKCPTIKQLTAIDVEDFKHYLLHHARPLNKSKSKKLGGGVASAIFSKFTTALRHGVEDGKLPQLSLRGIKGIPTPDSNRTYLTTEELLLLVATPCREYVRKLFLFSCFTGIRGCDMRRLMWEDFYTEDGVVRLTMRQQKTGRVEYLYLSPQALQLVGWEEGKKGRVFERHNVSQECLNRHLKDWVCRAGIKKKITMHCARHTFATMMLTRGAEITVVSKLLGHRNISETMTYAKVVDKVRKEAVYSFPQILKEE